MASDPVFRAAVNIGQALVSSANPNRDGTGTIVLIWTAGASGGEIDWVTIKARSSTTAGMIRLFLHDGATFRGLLKEIVVPQTAPSATVPSFEALVPFTMNVNGVPGLPLPMKAGWSLRASTEQAQQFDVIAAGGDF